MKRLAFMISKNIPKHEQESFSGRGSVNHNDLIYLYCKNIESWPESWEIAEEDVVIGMAIMSVLTLFDGRFCTLFDGELQHSIHARAYWISRTN